MQYYIEYYVIGTLAVVIFGLSSFSVNCFALKRCNKFVGYMEVLSM